MILRPDAKFNLAITPRTTESLAIGTRAVNAPRGAIYVTKVIARIESVFYVVNSERGAPMPIVGTGITAREIARLYPATVSVFDRFNVDLCCEAGLSLSVAASKHKLDLNQFLRELNDAVGAQTVVK